MAGEIKHEWVGTTLIITSDSGTSGCNLKGSTGDIGPRGPQGPCGVIYSPDGEAVLDNYVTIDKLDDYVTMNKLIEVLTAINIAEEGEY